MKKLSIFKAALLLFAAAGAAASCEELTGRNDKGSIQISLSKDFYAQTKALSNVPDPGDFLLTVTDAKGNIIFNGSFASSPEQMEVDAGSYTVSIRSRDFTEPLFEAPQWGDTQIAAVAAGQCVSVLLNCVQMNSGIRLVPDATFRTAFPESTLYLKGAGGSLMYSYTEKRTAFFQPGMVSVVLSNGGSQESLCSRQLSAQEMLTLGLSANLGEYSSGKIGVQVDTTRNWVMDGFTAGGASTYESAYSVTEARDHIGEKDAWVQGYMIGVATNTGKFAFDPPFSKNTNIVIGLRSSTTDPEYMLSVELPKGNIRDALNLQDNPGLLGRPVRICGEIAEAYYGIPGLKSPKEYRL